MHTDAAAATALPSPDPHRIPRFVPEPPIMGEQERFVLDLFRLLRLFRERYDEAWLSRAEALAERRLGAEADAYMGAAVMLDNELRCRGVSTYASGRPGDPRPVGSEALFLAFLDAAARRTDAGAARAAAALGAGDHRFLSAMAARLVDLAACGAGSLGEFRGSLFSRGAAKAKLTSRNMFE